MPLPGHWGAGQHFEGAQGAWHAGGGHGAAYGAGEHLEGACGQGITLLGPCAEG